MRKARSWWIRVLAGLATIPCGAHAASVSYVLDQSNADSALPDGRAYLQVTVTDNGAGAVDFTIDALPALGDFAGANSGIRSFAFDVKSTDGILLPENIMGLPTGWSIKSAGSAGDFGIFDVVLSTGMSRPLSPHLTFSIVGIADDSIDDYVQLSTGRAERGHAYYAARVVGFLDQDPGPRPLTAAWFGGSSQVATAPVPLPASALLLASALGWLSAVARRNREHRSA